jgi:hypothetical protein
MKASVYFLSMRYMGMGCSAASRLTLRTYCVQDSRGQKGNLTGSKLKSVFYPPPFIELVISRDLQHSPTIQKYI